MAATPVPDAGGAGRRRRIDPEVLLHTPAKVQKKSSRRPRTPRTRLAGGPSRLGRVGHPRPGVADRRAHPPETSGRGAPWTIVGATDDRYRDLTVARTISRRADRAGVRLRPRTPRADHRRIGLRRLRRKAPTCCRASTCRSRWTATSSRKQLAKQQARAAPVVDRGLATGCEHRAGLEGWDAAGKGGGDPAGDRCPRGGRTSASSRSRRADREERRYHYLWRFWRDHRRRRAGFVIFDRTWYGRVLVEQPRRLCDARGVAAGLRRIKRLRGPTRRAGPLRGEVPGCTSPPRNSWRGSRLARSPTRSTRSPRGLPQPGEMARLRQGGGPEDPARTTSEGAQWHVIAANDKRFAGCRR